MPVSCDTARQVLEKALQDRVFTAAVLLVGREDRTLLLECLGDTGGPDAVPTTPETLFDLASLTKVLATTPVWMKLAEEKKEILEESMAHWFPGLPGDKRGITPRLLLSHSSGLPAWRPYYLHRWPEQQRKKLTLERILSEPLVFPPGEGTLYSDLGFMLLAFIAEKETGEQLETLARRRIFDPLSLGMSLMFHPPRQERRIAATRPGDPPGLVNDLNARALGGAAGHAGLFGTAEAVAALGWAIMDSFRSSAGFFDNGTARLFCSRVSTPPGSTRCLGFDTPSLVGSSSGHHFSTNSLGHTGFTGTSLWMDPQRDLVVVLLTNRVFLGESDFRIRSLRPEIHDAVIEGLGELPGKQRR